MLGLVREEPLDEKKPAGVLPSTGVPATGFIAGPATNRTWLRNIEKSQWGIRCRQCTRQKAGVLQMACMPEGLRQVAQYCGSSV